MAEMIDRTKEETFPLRRLPKKVGISREYGTIYTWTTKGLHNSHTDTTVKLETVRGPAGMETSVEAYFRFLAKLDEKG